MKFVPALVDRGWIVAGLLLAGCGDEATLKDLSAKINNEVVRAQVALEDATQEVQSIRDAEAEMAEQEALAQAGEGLEGVREGNIEEAQGLQQQRRLQQAQQKLQQQASGAERAEPVNPYAGRPADQLSSTLPP